MCGQGMCGQGMCGRGICFGCGLVDEDVLGGFLGWCGFCGCCVGNHDSGVTGKWLVMGVHTSSPQRTLCYYTTSSSSSSCNSSMYHRAGGCVGALMCCYCRGLGRMGCCCMLCCACMCCCCACMCILNNCVTRMLSSCLCGKAPQCGLTRCMDQLCELKILPLGVMWVGM